MSFVTNSSSHSSSPDPTDVPRTCPRTQFHRSASPARGPGRRPLLERGRGLQPLPQPLIDEYYGQYVAVYNGNIVDADPDEGELALRFYRTFGYVPVYIHKVGTEEGLGDDARVSEGYHARMDNPEPVECFHATVSRGAARDSIRGDAGAAVVSRASQCSWI